MDKRYEALFTPWKIGNVEIKNRIVLCPMGGTSLFGWVEPHHFDKEAAAFFLKRAENNVGLIIPGIAPLRNMLGNGWLYKANGAFKKLKPFMEKIHATGAKLFVQLTAGFGRSFALDDMMALLVRNKVLGALARPVIDPSYLCAAPSASPSRWAEDTMCREMTLKEIKKIIFAYAETAKKLMDAGVDCIKLEGRAKSAYYVACVTQAYRRAIDFFWEHPEEELPASILEETEKISHRTYSTGFYFGHEPGEMPDRGQYTRNYELVAICQGREGDYLRLTQRNRFFAGQEVDILQPGREPLLATLEQLKNGDWEPIEKAPHAEMTVYWKTDLEVQPGAYLRVKKAARAV